MGKIILAMCTQSFKNMQVLVLLLVIVSVLVVGHSAPTKQEDSEFAGHNIEVVRQQARSHDVFNYLLHSFFKQLNNSYKELLSDTAEDGTLKDYVHLLLNLFQTQDQDMRRKSMRSLLNFFYTSAGIGDTVIGRELVPSFIELVLQKLPLSVDTLNNKFKLGGGGDNNDQNNEDHETALENFFREGIKIISTYSEYVFAPKSSDTVLLREVKNLLRIALKSFVKNFQEKFQEVFDKHGGLEGGNNQLLSGQGGTDVAGKNRGDSMEADEQAVLSVLLPILTSLAPKIIEFLLNHSD